MAKIKILFTPDYMDYFYKVKDEEKEQRQAVMLEKYIAYAVNGTHVYKYPTCIQAGGEWYEIKVLNMAGQKYNKYLTTTGICLAPNLFNKPLYILINNIGRLFLYDARSISLTDQFVETALRSAQVMTALNAVGVKFDMPAAEKLLASVYTEYKETFDFIETIGQKIGAAYQQSAKFLNDTLHINLLTKVHQIGVMLSPEYKEFYKGQEAELASYSSRIFGDNHLMSNYVHVAELYFAIQIKNTDRNENQKRHDTLVQSQKMTARIKKRIRHYENDPVGVYGDLLYYTFGEGNKYIDKHGIYEGADAFEQLEGAGIKITEWRDKLNDLRLFDTALDKVNLSILDERIERNFDELNNIYITELRPTFRVIQRIVDKQQKAIAEIEKRINHNNEVIEKARIMSSNPKDLTDNERTYQNDTFIKQFDSAIPGVSERFNFKTFDIKEFFDESK